jgi:hypothetical protein
MNVSNAESEISMVKIARANPHISPVSRKMAPDCMDARGRAMPGAIAEDRYKD